MHARDCATAGPAEPSHPRGTGEDCACAPALCCARACPPSRACRHMPAPAKGREGVHSPRPLAPAQVIAKYVKTVAELNAAIGKAGGKVVLEVLGAADAERGAAAGADAAGADPAGDGAASCAGGGGEQSEEGQWI